MIDKKTIDYALSTLDKEGQRQKTAKDRAYYDGMLTMLRIIVSDGWQNDVFVRKDNSGAHYIFAKPPKGVFNGGDRKNDFLLHPVFLLVFQRTF